MIRLTHRPTHVRRFAVFVIACASLILAGCGKAHQSSDAGASPLAKYALYRNPDNPAQLQEQAWKSQGQTAEAAAIDVIAREPTAFWLSPSITDVAGQTRGIVDAAATQHALPVMVAYNIPDRDCGSYSSGGAIGADAYRLWITQVVSGLGQRPAVIILEPDAVASSIIGCSADTKERFALLAQAVQALKSDANAFVYLDAGNPGWVSDLSRLAGGLVESGIRQADGFALNVSNFIATPNDISYGRDLSNLLAGAHFVVDTSRNGRGAAGNGPENWCNPPGRALGHEPTTNTGQPLVDAYLWIKQPGESDGSCNRGEPSPGTWWPDYALGLAMAAQPSK